MANRTINFHGYAWGDEPVQMNAHINGELVFSGAVATIGGPMPDPDVNMEDAPVLFSLADSALYPTSYSGAYPMTISVATGSGIGLSIVQSNYTPLPGPTVTFIGSISGTTLTVTSVISGEVSVGQTIGSAGDTVILSGSGSTWEVSKSQTVPEREISGHDHGISSADVFNMCFDGAPTNSDGTPDCRSSVSINGIQQVPPLEKSTGTWYWFIDAGSTLECNFNVSVGRD
jgi:hypothetical protein